MSIGTYGTGLVGFLCGIEFPVCGTLDGYYFPYDGDGGSVFHNVFFYVVWVPDSLYLPMTHYYVPYIFSYKMYWIVMSHKLY